LALSPGEGTQVDVILRDGRFKLVGNGETTHVEIGMAGGVLGTVGNQVVARSKLTVWRRIQSATLIADARHSWLDALSSFGALGVCRFSW
jgi:divalent metal cation (Fe/Co/Zn/Cd) transporter